MASRNDTTDGLAGGWGIVASWTDWIKSYPRDLGVVCAGVLLAALAVEVLPTGSTLRVLVAAPLALLWPGYALVALLFPSSTGIRGGDLSSSVRVALGFGTSLAVVALTLVAVGTVAPLSVTTVLATLVVLTLALAQVAAVRRLRLPAARRHVPSFRQELRRWTAQFDRHRDLAGKASVTLLAVGVVLAASTAALAVASPPDGQQFTSFAIATENENGSLQTADYPTELTRGESASLVAVVDNREDVTERYHVVVQLQRVDGERVVERRELARFSKTVSAGEQWRRGHTVTPTTTGEDLQLQYLLYRDAVPADPTRANAYRSLALDVDVAAP